MNELFQYTTYALIGAAAIGIPLLISAWVMVGARAASLWVLVYFVLLFSFPNASWGLVETTSGSNFYTRGTGLFFFSAINLMLYGLAFQSFVARRFASLHTAPHNLKFPAAIFGVLMLGNLAIGLVLPDVTWFQLLAPSGLMNFLNLMVAFYVLTTCFGDEKSLDRLINVLLVVVVIRGPLQFS